MTGEEPIDGKLVAGPRKLQQERSRFDLAPMAGAGPNAIAAGSVRAHV
jgi:hypothetical protein